MRDFAGLHKLALAAILVVGALGAAGCPPLGGPVVECNDPQKTYPCPDGTCAETPGACADVDPGCPAEYPFRCNENYCADWTNQCAPGEDGEPQEFDDEWVFAPNLPNS